MEKSLNLTDISGPTNIPSDSPDNYTSEEILHNTELHRLHRQSLAQDIRERKHYAKRLFKLVSWWLVGMFMMTIAYGWVDSYFKPSENVMLALIGSTTVNVLGLFIIVAKYLFPSHKQDDIQK